MYQKLISNHYWKTIIIGGVSLIGCLLIYILRLNSVVGEFKDDAWYVLLAESLLKGQGYQLINFPIQGVTPFYPPVFPTLLAIAYSIYPSFPENIWLLKSVSIIAMLLSGVVIYFYFQQHRNLPKLLALTIALATVTSPAF